MGTMQSPNYRMPTDSRAGGPARGWVRYGAPPSSLHQPWPRGNPSAWHRWEMGRTASATCLGATRVQATFLREGVQGERTTRESLVPESLMARAYVGGPAAGRRPSRCFTANSQQSAPRGRS